MGETTLSRYVMDGMRGRWDAQRHEDQSPFIPDISFGIATAVQGWIELKTIPHRPAKETTPIRIAHETRWNRQREWLKRRGLTGASCWMLLRLERSYLLFHWSDLGKVGEVDEIKLNTLARMVWTKSINFNDLELELVGGGANP